MVLRTPAQGSCSMAFSWDVFDVILFIRLRIWGFKRTITGYTLSTRMTTITWLFVGFLSGFLPRKLLVSLFLYATFQKEATEHSPHVRV